MRAIKRPGKFIKFYGAELEYLKQLKPIEFTLYLCYRSLADWDERHKETYGTITLSINELIKNYLPGWSRTKISNARSALVKKGFISWKDRETVFINNYAVFRIKDVRQAEHFIRLIAQGVNPEEQIVQYLGTVDMPRRKRLETMKQEILGQSQLGVPNSEHRPS